MEKDKIKLKKKKQFCYTTHVLVVHLFLRAESFLLMFKTTYISVWNCTEYQLGIDLKQNDTKNLRQNSFLQHFKL